MAKADDRLTLPSLGEWCHDLLMVDAAVSGRSPTIQLQYLGCAKLQEREARIRERVEYLANKRGISFDEMWRQLVTGKYSKITPSEWAELSEEEDDDD